VKGPAPSCGQPEAMLALAALLMVVGGIALAAWAWSR